MKIAIIGASGLVGRKMLQVLVEKQIKVDDLYLAASDQSAGKTMNFGGYDFPLNKVSEVLKQKPDVVLLSAGADVSKELSPLFAEYGAFVIDNSSAWRKDEKVPLVVPEINAHVIDGSQKIIANPNCSTIQLVVVLAPLHSKYKLRRVVVSTYQSVSGSGKKGIDQLINERRGIAGNAVYPYPIDHNILPQGGSFLDNAYSTEEMKLIEESRKIMGLPDLNITATVARVPVISCHSESVNAEFYNDFKIEDIQSLLKEQSGIAIMDDISQNIYPMPLLAYDKNEVFVGRLRKDLYNPNTLNLWIVADNIRKGAATNAIQIMELLISKNLIV